MNNRWAIPEYQSGPLNGIELTGVLAARCLRDAGTVEDEAVLRTATQLGVQTLFGHFQLDPDTGLQVGAEILVVQWRAGERRVVWPLPKAERQILPLRGQ